MDILYTESGKLTDLVKGTNITINTTNTYAIEKQAAIPICYGSAEGAWDAAVAYNGTPSNYPGKTFDNVGWVRGTRQQDGEWGAYLWVLQNQIAFRSSETNWWVSPSNGVRVAISNVLVGSLGDYPPMADTNDIGPYLDAATNNFPGADTSDDKSFGVDITNVYYRLIIPSIWITPRSAVACVGGSNVQFTVTGTNIPQGVTWTLSPTNFVGHAGFQVSTTNYALVTPGTAATNYKVRATSKDNTNFYDEVNLAVLKVDIVQTNILALVGSINNVGYNLTSESYTNVTWTITPDYGTNGTLFAGGPTGAGTTNVWPGTNVWLSPGNVVASYTLTAYANALTNCRDTATCTVVNIELEPVTIRPGNGATFPLYNPCGIATGQTAQFEIKVDPSNAVDNDNIVWTNMSGSISFQGGNAGRLVTVKADGTGVAQLRVDIKDFVGTAPTIQTEGLEPKTIKASVWIVRKDDGTDPATTEARVTNLIAQANDIFKQTAMTLVLDGSIHYTNRREWLVVEKHGDDWPEFNVICSITNGTGGLEIYFVDIIDEATGLNGSTGLLLSDNANFRTTAHEIGHASGLKDGYLSGGGFNVTGTVTSSWEPDDWNSGPSPQYYERTLSQQDLLQRLLMYGLYSTTKSDLPRGNIHGVWYELQLIGGSWTQVWHLSLDAVGLSDMSTRQPAHN